MNLVEHYFTNIVNPYKAIEESSAKLKHVMDAINQNSDLNLIEGGRQYIIKIFSEIPFPYPGDESYYDVCTRLLLMGLPAERVHAFIILCGQKYKSSIWEYYASTGIEVMDWNSFVNCQISTLQP